MALVGHCKRTSTPLIKTLLQPVIEHTADEQDLSIVVQDLRVAYPTRTGPIQALRDVSFAVTTGQFVALVGPSGCGKSTLLRVLGGLTLPSGGTVTVQGVSPEQVRRQRAVSFMFQQPVLLPWRTALQNVALPLRIFGWPRQQRREAAQAMLELVGLHAFAGAYPFQLSGGMQQRVALARSLVFDPAVLLMDEPFGALDELTREHLNGELLRIWTMRRSTVMFVTHALAEAVFLADRVLVLSPGPGTIVADVAIDLPRPRTTALLEQEAFLQQVAALRREFRKNQELGGRGWELGDGRQEMGNGS